MGQTIKYVEVDELERLIKLDPLCSFGLDDNLRLDRDVKSLVAVLVFATGPNESQVRCEIITQVMRRVKNDWYPEGYHTIGLDMSIENYQALPEHEVENPL